jgi:hypothetical protein
MWSARWPAVGRHGNDAGYSAISQISRHRRTARTLTTALARSMRSVTTQRGSSE